MSVSRQPKETVEQTKGSHRYGDIRRTSSNSLQDQRSWADAVQERNGKGRPGSMPSATESKRARRGAHSRALRSPTAWIWRTAHPDRRGSRRQTPKGAS